MKITVNRCDECYATTYDEPTPPSSSYEYLVESGEKKLVGFGDGWVAVYQRDEDDPIAITCSHYCPRHRPKGA